LCVVGVVIVKDNASRILMPVLIRCGTLNCPCVPKGRLRDPTTKCYFSFFKSGKL
jgi:hypothetical protein